MSDDAPSPTPPPFALPALVSFDLDGTLVDTAPDLAAAVDDALTVRGLPPRGTRKIRDWVGNGAERLVRRAISDGGEGDEVDAQLVDDVLRGFLARYKLRFTEKSRLYPGVKELLVALRERGVALACITNKPLPFVEPLFAALRLEGFFGLVLGGESLPRKKPDPLPLVHTMDHFGVTPSRTLHVGDSESDVRAARAARVRIVAVSYGYNHGRDIRDAAPDALIDWLPELLPLLGLTSPARPRDRASESASVGRR